MIWGVTFFIIHFLIFIFAIKQKIKDEIKLTIINISFSFILFWLLLIFYLFLSRKATNNGIHPNIKDNKLNILNLLLSSYI